MAHRASCISVRALFFVTEAVNGNKVHCNFGIIERTEQAVMKSENSRRMFASTMGDSNEKERDK